LRHIRNWTVDTVAPAAPQLLQPGELATVLESRPTIGGSGEAFAEITLLIDGIPDSTVNATYSGAWSLETTRTLNDAIHSFTAVAKDIAGNISPASGTMTLRIDANDPVTTLQSKPGPVANRSSSTFNFSADEQATFECKVDGSPFESCEAPVLVSDLTDGSHSFFVRSTDAVGRHSAVVQYSWLIDTTGPVVTVSQNSPPPGISPTFSFNSNELGTTYRCRIDGVGGFTTCTSPLNIPTLSVGPHRLELRAIDAVGNVSPRTIHFTILAPPVSSPSTPPQPSPVTPANPEPRTCRGTDGQPTEPAAISLLAARSAGKSVRVTLSSDRYALIEVSIKRGSKVIASSTKPLKRGRRSVSLRANRSRMGSSGLSLVVAAITLDGARSTATAPLGIGTSGRITLGSDGKVTQSSTLCAAAANGKGPRVIVKPERRPRAIRKQVGLSVKSPNWTLAVMTITQKALVARQVVLLPPARWTRIAMRPVQGSRFLRGHARFVLEAATVDGIWRSSSRRITLK
jgi:hypothetical protein